jgi:hypothetical protein
LPLLSDDRIRQVMKRNTIMTPIELAHKIIARSKEKAKHPSFYQDDLVKEIASAISEERELISRYLQFLNESIAIEPHLVRHRLLIGSSRISTGKFIDEMHPDEHKKYALRLNTTHTRYYVRG